MANQIVLVPQKLLENPPSVREGLPFAVEQQQRIYGCHLIQKAGVLLKLEAVSIASAQTILHRFFFRRSLKQFDVRRVATASLLLACKLEEDPRRVMHLIGVIWLLSQLEDQPNMELKEETLDNFIIDFDSQEYELFRMDVFRCERYILRELGFMVSQTLVHPHRYILQYIHALFKDNFLFTNQLSQKAWGYLNDSMRTTLCCEVHPAVIAVGSIFLAACDLGIPLPREIGWYELFDVSWDDVIKVCSTILSLYTLPPPAYVKLADEMRLMQKAPNNTTSGTSSSARGVPASSSSSTSNKTRTAHATEELPKAVAVEGSSANRSSDSLNSREGCRVLVSSSSSSSGSGSGSSSSTGRSLFTSRGGVFAGGDSGSGKECSSASAPAANYNENESCLSVSRAPGDASKERPHISQIGLQATSAGDEKRSSREELLNKPTARFSRAQPRAPPPLKERSQIPGRSSSNQDVQATSSGRGMGGSPSSSSSFHGSCRGDMVASSSSSSRSTASSSSSRSTASSSSGCSGSGDAVAATDALPGSRLKYIHFSSSRVSPSSDKPTKQGYSSAAAAVRRGSPRRRDGRDSEPSARNSSISPTRPNGRSFDREEGPRGRQDRTEASRRGGSSSSIQASSLLGAAGEAAGDKENLGRTKEESSHNRLSQWSGSLSSNRSGAGRTSGSVLQDGFLGIRDNETSGDRSDALRKGGETCVASHIVAAAAGILQTRSSISLFARRNKDENDSFRASSGDTVSLQHPDISHVQRLSRTSRSANTGSGFLSTTSAAKNYGTAASATSVRDPEESGAGNFHYERRQRSPSWSLRCSQVLQCATAVANDGEKRSVKRQRRPPPHP